MRKWISLSSLISLLIIWYIIYLIIDHPILMPSVSDTVYAGIDLLKSVDTWHAFGITLVRLSIGVGISFLLAIVLSFISYKVHVIEIFLNPYMMLFKTIPLVSVIIIIFVLLHFSIAPYVITFLMVFPIMYQAFLSGLKQIDQTYIDVFSLESNQLKPSITYLYYPMTRPFILLGLLQSIGLGIKVLVMAEFLTQSQNGIGRLLYDARVNLAYDQIFFLSIILVTTTYLLEKSVKKIA